MVSPRAAKHPAKYAVGCDEKPALADFRRAVLPTTRQVQIGHVEAPVPVQKPALFDRHLCDRDLCLSVFHCAEFRQRKGAIKVTIPQRSQRLFARVHGHDRCQISEVRVAKSLEKLDLRLFSDSINQAETTRSPETTRHS